MIKVIITYLGTDDSHKTGMLSMRVPFNNPIYYKIVPLEKMRSAALHATIEDKKKQILYIFGVYEDELCSCIVEQYYYDDSTGQYIL